jgi:hypothetical protein
MKLKWRKSAAGAGKCIKNKGKLLFSATLPERPPADPSSSPITCAICKGKNQRVINIIIHIQLVDNHFRGQYLVHYRHVAFDMENDVQLLVVGAHLLGVRVVVPNGTVTAFGYDTCQITQRHNLSLQLPRIFGRVFRKTI